MTDNLVRIKHVQKDGYDEPIEDLKIYLNLNKGQYVHKFECDRCGKEVGCYCYDELEAAVEDMNNISMVCDKCFIREQIYENYWEDDLLIHIIDENEGTDFKTLIKLVVKIEDCDIDSGIGDIFWKEIDHIINNMNQKTKDKLYSHFCENYDFDMMYGSSCSV